MPGCRGRVDVFLEALELSGRVVVSQTVAFDVHFSKPLDWVFQAVVKLHS